MKEKTVEIGELTLHFTKEKSNWQLTLPKSQTKVKDVKQMDLLKQPSDYFSSLEIEEKEDAFLFHMAIDESHKNWEEIRKLNTNEKLRLLCNLVKMDRFLSTRITFHLHPETILFDDNLMLVITYRGLRNLVPPFEFDESQFLKQFKCFAIALVSKKYDFDQLYNGSLRNADETEFQRQVRDIEDLAELKSYLQEAYRKEQDKTEKTMTLVPLKKFRLFKQLAIIMIVVSVLIAIPLAYYGFVKSPYQDKLLTAHGQYLSSDYGEIISTLRDVDPEGLPFRTKFILANSYIHVENLSEREKEVILRNVSLRSDPDYLLYWIYNGRGEFEQSLEKAKYIDDGQLIMYGLIKQMEEARNNPELTGTEREERLNELQDELVRYQEQYDLNEENEEGMETEAVGGSAGEDETLEEEQEEKEETQEKQEKKKEKKKEENEDK